MVVEAGEGGEGAGRARPPKYAASAPQPWATVPGDPKHSYTPKGFAPNFREMIVHDLGQVIDVKLGKNFSLEKRQKIAEIQNEFWDEQGPNVDAFQSHQIGQPEFAEKTHLAFIHSAEKYAQVLTPNEYEKLFDSPPGSDPYPMMFHSKNEQPGLPVNPYDNGSEPPPAVGPPPGEPPPSTFKAAGAKGLSLPPLPGKK